MLNKKQFGTWALVTGASSGIGEGFAIELARQGFNLVLIARNRNGLENLAARLEVQHKIRTKVLVVDVAEANLIAHIASEIDGLDIGLVISNAGAGQPRPFVDLLMETIERHLNLNGLAHARLAHYFAPKMVAKGRGGLLFIGAMGASEGIPWMANDAAAKAYVISLARSLHQELRSSGIHVSVVSPSAVASPVIAKLGFDGIKMPMQAASVESFVREALGAVAKNRNSLVSGRLFRIFLAILSKNALTRLNGRMLFQAYKVLESRNMLA